jgi:hypothetical protein
MERAPSDAMTGESPGGDETVRLVIEAYDFNSGKNLVRTETIKAMEFADRMDVVKRMLSSLGLALVRHDLSVGSDV